MFQCMIYVCTKFHVPSSTGSLVNIMKPTAKYTFHTATILFYIIQFSPEQKMHNSRRSASNTHNFRAHILCATVVPPQKFVRPPLYYHRP